MSTKNLLSYKNLLHAPMFMLTVEMSLQIFYSNIMAHMPSAYGLGKNTIFNKVQFSSVQPQTQNKAQCLAACRRTCVRKQPIIALYFESENEPKFYNLEPWPQTYFVKAVRYVFANKSNGKISSLGCKAFHTTSCKQLGGSFQVLSSYDKSPCSNSM